MTWRAMTKAASGVACAVPAECTCRSAAHCHSTRPRQMEPSVGSALRAAVGRCVATAQADELPVTANITGRSSASRWQSQASVATVKAQSSETCRTSDTRPRPAVHLLKSGGRTRPLCAGRNYAQAVGRGRRERRRGAGCGEVGRRKSGHSFRCRVHWWSQFWRPPWA